MSQVFNAVLTRLIDPFGQHLARRRNTFWFPSATHGLIATHFIKMNGRMIVRKRSLTAIAFQLMVAAAIVSLAINTQAQTPTPTPQASPAQTVPAAPPANSADVATMDAIGASLYDVISGPPGARNWDRVHSLFVPGARLIPTGARPTGEVGSRVMTVEDYATRSGPFLEKNGFFEREVSRR